MRTTVLKHVVVGAIATTTVLLATAGLASAHLEPDPIAMEAGSSGTVAFTVEHGCEGSPTTSLKFEIPDGLTGVTPVDKDGWTATLTGNVLEFAGGPLPADQEDNFDITFTAPTQPGEITFPIIQTCEQGELAWIQVAAEGAEEPELPVPTIKITDGPPTAADLAPEHEEATDDTAHTEGTEGTDAVSTTVAASPSDDSSNTGVIIVVVIVLVVAVVGGGVLLTRRQNSSRQP